jgi:hypothetical protein
VSAAAAAASLARGTSCSGALRVTVVSPAPSSTIARGCRLVSFRGVER